MQAATIESQGWWAQARGDRAQGWNENYQKSLHTRHRTIISQIVGELGDVQTILEVGCHCGPNLIRLATDYPQLRGTGLDVSADAITFGTAWVAQRHLQDRITLRQAPFPQGTEHLASGSVDVVLTCYAIGAYMADADLTAALYEMGRLAKRAVILAEPMIEGPTRAKHTMNGYIEWHHDYRRAIQWISTLNQRRARIVPVAPPVDSLDAILVLES